MIGEKLTTNNDIICIIELLRYTYTTNLDEKEGFGRQELANDFEGQKDYDK